jgi:hypothetical protein
MRKILTLSMVLAILTGTLLHINCKKSDETEVFSLTVFVNPGVTGTPGTGAYTYEENDQVVYDYSAKDAYINLRVTFDGDEVANTGTVTITGQHNLNASADPDPAALPLTVSLSAGVTGTPTAGVYYYFPNSQVDYSYGLAEDYKDLRVTFDGVEVANSGTITILQDDHALNATAVLQYDIRDPWLLEEKYSDGSEFTVTLTFSGDIEGGTVTDSDGGTGTYTVQGSSVNFTLEYPDITYEYNGSIISRDNMTGFSSRIIRGGETITGDWTAVRSSLMSTAAPASNNYKGE